MSPSELDSGGPARAWPAGLYEHVMTAGRRRGLGGAGSHDLPVDEAELSQVLAQYLARCLHLAMERAPSNEERLALAQAVLDRTADLLGPDTLEDDDSILEPVALLHEVFGDTDAALAGAERRPSPRPAVPLSSNDVLTNLRDEARIGDEVKSELACSDRVDLLCSFLIHSGFRVIEEALQRFFERGGRLRVLTTTYVGITERRVLERLVEMGAQVRVSYGRRTKLHAKSWIFERDTGFSTAFIGSSNLSHSALLDGIEWNVRLAAMRDPVTFGKIRGTFERYWSGGDFEDFDAERFEDERRAAKGSSGGGDAAHVASNLLAIDLRPYPFQRGILDQIAAERRKHGRNRATEAT